MPPLDVFLVLKMSCDMGTLLNSVEGVENFMLTMRTLQPKAVLLFDHHADPHVDASSAASQLLAIDESFRLAESHGEYAYFMRYRPDFIMLEGRLEWPRVRDDTIYTSRKLDAPASDQAFLISRSLKAQWWGKLQAGRHLLCVSRIHHLQHGTPRSEWSVLPRWAAAPG
jgi:hypothetical protein